MTSLGSKTKKGPSFFFFLWTFVVAIVSFYAGFLIGMSAVTSRKDDLTQKEHDVNSKAKVDSDKTTYRRLQPRFPSPIAELFSGAALVDKSAFLERFDIGYARTTKIKPRNSQVLILYQRAKAMPSKYTNQTSFDGPMPVLSVEEAMSNCQSLNVVAIRPFSGLRQCLALAGEFESYHVLRWMRNVYGKPVNGSSFDLRRVGRGVRSDGLDEMPPPPTRSQERNWKQIVKYFSAITRLRNSLKPILKEITGAEPTYVANDGMPRPAVIVMVCNLGQADLLFNFCCNARAKGLDITSVLVFCTDKETYDIVTAIGMHAFYNENLFKSVPSEEASNYGDAVFGDVMFAKVVAVHLVAQIGYDVLFQDVDIIWNKNPVDFFQSHYKDFDIIFQDDGARTVRFSPYAGNTGFYYVRLNRRTRYMLTNLVYLGDQVDRSASHQQVMTTVVSEHAMLFGLKVKTMSGDPNFPNGYHFHRDRAAMKKIVAGEVVPMIFHMCWTESRSNKLKFMEQMGMWQVQDECKTGPQLYSTLKSQGKDLNRSCCADKPSVVCHFSDKPSIIPCHGSPKMDAAGLPFW